jgi:hypothetical protein
MLISWLKKIGIVFIELAVIAGLLSYVYQKKNFQSVGQIAGALQELVSNVETRILQKQKEVLQTENKPLELLDPVSRVFNWEYRGVKYSLTEKFYQSLYEYYKAQPKSFSYTGELKTNWQEDYYGMFLTRAQNDDSISALAKDLQELGRKNKLSDDQIVDLTLAFVQTIEYDDLRAKEILSKTENVRMQYPYETLFLQSGVCSDKSLLATVLLRALGYGTAIFTYEQDNHMAIGIECPKDSSTYGSGYCYAETTSIGNKIGIVPTLDTTSNKTVGATELLAIDSVQAQQAKLQQLGQVTIFQKSTGKQYFEVIETKKIIAEIDKLKKSIETMLPELQAQQKNIKKEENQLADMKKTLESYQNSQNTEKYNSLVVDFNNFLEKYKKDVKKYNENVALYNKTIARYNVLIKQ